MNKKTLVSTAAVFALLVGLMGSTALAQGQGQENRAAKVGDIEAQETVIVSSGDHGTASDSYQNAAVVETLVLGEGAWKVTATGAVSLDGDPIALNCGLREGTTMLAKQNPAVGGETGRVGFSVVGATSVAEGETTEVDLVCYGGGALPFEHNVVAIGGTTLDVQG